jgi:hypothetical protein
MPAYPDPSGGPPQGRPHYATALWLLARHPQLAELAMRIPGAIDPDGDLDLDRLAGAVRELDANILAWGEFRRTHGEPSDHADEATYEAWRAAGPQRTPGADALADMSDTERARVRFLAFWSGLRVGLGSADLVGLDAEGQHLVADWCAAVEAS